MWEVGVMVGEEAVGGVEEWVGRGEEFEGVVVVSEGEESGECSGVDGVERVREEGWGYGRGRGRERGMWEVW